MANNINTMQIWCYINYHWNNTKIKSIQSKLFQCLFYTNKALNLGHLVKVLWKHLNITNTKGSPLCDVTQNPRSWVEYTMWCRDVLVFTKMPTLTSQPSKIKGQALENLQILYTYRESQPESEKSNPPISSKWW